MPNIDYQKPLSVYHNKQYELSVENGCVLWGSRVVIPHCGHQHVLELLHACMTAIQALLK